jgi:hypothetical protein
MICQYVCDIKYYNYYYLCKHTVQPLADQVPYVHNLAQQQKQPTAPPAAAPTAFNGCSLKHTLLLFVSPLLLLHFLLLLLPLLVVLLFLLLL